MTTKKEKPTVEAHQARVLCDFNLNGTALFVGDVIAAPKNLMDNGNLDPHPDAVKYAISNGAVVKQIEPLDSLI